MSNCPFCGKEAKPLSPMRENSAEVCTNTDCKMYGTVWFKKEGLFEELEKHQTRIVSLEKIMLSDKAETQLKNIEHKDGCTYGIETGCGRLWVTVNHDKSKRIIEVFENMSPVGGCGSAQTASVGILLSLYLQQGGDIVRAFKLLKETSCPRPYGFGEDKVISCTDAMLKAVRIHAMRLGYLISGEKVNTAVKVEQKTAPVESKIVPAVSGVMRCPDCKSELVLEGRCYICRDCGYSTCP